MRRRRLSTALPNVQRRLSNRLVKVAAGVVIALVVAAWQGMFGGTSGGSSVGGSDTTVSTQHAAASQQALQAVSANNAAISSTAGNSPTPDSAGEDLDALIAAHRDAPEIEVAATIARVLVDDKKAPRHQRFTIETSSGNRVLVAHNIDIAERVPDLHKGDPITLNGEFIWNEKGGVLHWTHHDPDHRHADGWIEHDGHRYQ